MRLFYGIIPSAQTRDALLRAQDELKIMGRGRFVRADRLHLTLRFLGDCDDEGLIRAQAALAKVAASHPPFPLRLDGLSSFGRIAHARVYGGEALQALARDLGEQGKYAPHITLARDYAPPAHWPDIASISWTAGEITLFESILGPNAYYVARETAALWGG